jgi:hypothetical protein
MHGSHLYHTNDDEPCEPMNQHTSLAQPEIAAPSKTEVALLRRLDIFLQPPPGPSFFLRFEELAEQPPRKAFVIVFEILLEAASSPPGKSSSVPVLHSKQSFAFWARALRSF